MAEKYGKYPTCYSKTVDNLYKLDNGICPLCGKKVNKKNLSSYNVDHVVPQIVFKYAKDTGLNDLCNGYSNLILVHKLCNLKKGIDFLDVNMLYLSKSRKQSISDNIAKCEQYIEDFKTLRKVKVEEQNFKCRLCNCGITESDAVLRRKDCGKERSLQNSFAVCKMCNRHYSNYKNSNISENINLDEFEKLNQTC